MIKNMLYGMVVLGCLSVDGMECERTDDGRPGLVERCVKFVEIEKPTEKCIDQGRLEEGDLDKEIVDENKAQGVVSFKSNNILDAQKKLIKAFFGNAYLEERYYGLLSNDISDKDVVWFYDNIYVGDKAVIVYLVKLLPTSVFWEKMRKLVYIPCGHY